MLLGDQGLLKQRVIALLRENELRSLSESERVEMSHYRSRIKQICMAFHYLHLRISVYNHSLSTLGIVCDLSQFQTPELPFPRF